MLSYLGCVGSEECGAGGGQPEDGRGGPGF